MENKVIKEYEGKRWYRVVKSFYIFFFALTLILANCIIFFVNKFDFWNFVITNIIIISLFGTVEGLFWYIARGKWGYPKDNKSVELG